MGSPSDYQREMFTRVLKGNIALDSKIFPTGTAGCLLDGLARQFLWEVGKNYLHGTGHGVGAALNVHEGPHRISPLLDPHPLKPGMIVSNEPGKNVTTMTFEHLCFKARFSAASQKDYQLHF